MKVETEPVASGGWRIATGFASPRPLHPSGNFYALYDGEAFGHPERGLLAAMAHAHPETPEHAAGARDSSQLAVHSLAEGYFGAARTLSRQRAASLALTAVNRWLFGQTRADAAQSLVPVSLTALLFQASRIGILQIGACQAYRYRDKALSPLLRAHLRVLPDGALGPSRAVGLDPELAIDYAEEPVEPGDRYILLGAGPRHSPDTLYAALSGCLEKNASADPAVFAECLLAALAGNPSVMVLDILQAPRASVTASAPLANLPLRPAPREGEIWDGFALGKTLYRGRYTILKAAYDTLENREVALKIPLPSMLQDEVFTAGFLREAWIGSTVRGTIVARYLDLKPERRSSLYLVMPLYKGETLEARLHRGPAVSLPEGLGIALKLCEAVQDLAAIQIVHRDLKPENVMLLPQNELRLLDLGLAYLPGIDVADSVKPGGTLRYMAPELLQGTPANARSEVFSLAVTFYRMFCAGAYPYGQRETVPLSRLRPDLPGWLGLILQRALAPDPMERFNNAGEFARAMQLGLIRAPEEPPIRRKLLPLSRLRIWQILTFIFAAGFLFLLLRGGG